MVIETALLSALVPAGVDAVKSLLGGLGRKIGGLSVDDEIKLKNADTDRVKVLAQLDTPVGTPSQWVVDLRSSFRYIAATICVVGGLGTFFVAPALAPLGAELASGAFGFIFGERMLLSLKGASK
jgi:hypothetical protein